MIRLSYFSLLLVTTIIALPIAGFSRTFKNNYISFEMLDTWKCQLEQTEWVCRSEDPQEAKEAVIILTAKEKGPTDTFPLYENHMNNPITVKTPIKPNSSPITAIKKSVCASGSQ